MSLCLKNFTLLREAIKPFWIGKHTPSSLSWEGGREGRRGEGGREGEEREGGREGGREGRRGEGGREGGRGEGGRGKREEGEWKRTDSTLYKCMQKTKYHNSGIFESTKFS